MSPDLLKMILNSKGIEADPIPTLNNLGRKAFLATILSRIETARNRNDWTDVEVAVGANLGEKDVSLALMGLITGGEEFVKKHAYSVVEESSRRLAREQLGTDIGILAKLQKNGHWSIKFTWIGGEVTCPSSHKFTFPQAILWCVISAMLVETNKDDAS